MSDEIAVPRALDEADAAIRAILEDVCALTGMGFAAVARVTDTQWIACQVLDRIAFGLKPGDELELMTTICDEIRRSGETIVIDFASGDELWQTHPTPMLYGFESYVSTPIVLADGSFFGTLCAIDPEPRVVSGSATIRAMQDHAERVALLLSEPPPSTPGATG